jgi:hypothetical protein
VPHEVNVHTPLPIELDLEREDDGHAVHTGRYLPHPSLPPRPNLRTDVVEDTHSDPTEPLGKHEIETGVVNENGQAHVSLGREGNETVHGASQERNMTQHLYKTYHREVVAVIDKLTTGVAHPVATDTEGGDRGVEFAQSLDDLGRVKIAGGLTRDHEHRVSHCGHRSLRYSLRAGDVGTSVEEVIVNAAAKARPG